MPEEALIVNQMFAPYGQQDQRTMKSPASDEKKHLCSNCLTAVQGAYCAHCGQKHHAVLRHFSQVVGEFFTDVLNFDSKLLGTLKPLLFQPGMLSEEYFANRRMRYVSPLKLYFFLSVITFFLVQQSIEHNVNVDDMIQVNTEKTDTDKHTTDKSTPSTSASITDADAPLEDININFNGRPWNAKTNPFNSTLLPNAVNTLINDRASRVNTVLKSKDWKKQVIHSLLSASPQALLLMLPFFALLLKLVYWFQNRLYMEHLIVALHNHSFLLVFLLIIVVSLQLGIWMGNELRWLQPAIVMFNSTLSICLPIYFFLSLKRVYQQGWRKTALKFCLLGLFYIFLLCFGLAMILAIGLMTL
jgi:hypothetical protein